MMILIKMRNKVQHLSLLRTTHGLRMGMGLGLEILECFREKVIPSMTWEWEWEAVSEEDSIALGPV